MTVSFTEDDEGKTVEDASGATLGLVTEIRGSTAYVDPDPGLGETIKADLGWADADSDEYTVDETAVDARVEERLVLRGEL